MLTIGTVAKSAGVGVETLRYYERRGLLSSALRSPAGYRLFPDDEVRRVRFVRRAQTLGFTLEEIGGLLALRVERGRGCAAVRRSAQRTRARVRARIADLRRVERGLVGLIGSCDAKRNTDPCPMLATLDLEGGS